MENDKLDKFLNEVNVKLKELKKRCGEANMRLRT